MLSWTKPDAFLGKKRKKVRIQTVDLRPGQLKATIQSWAGRFSAPFFRSKQRQGMIFLNFTDRTAGNSLVAEQIFYTVRCEYIQIPSISM